MKITFKVIIILIAGIIGIAGVTNAYAETIGEIVRVQGLVDLNRGDFRYIPISAGAEIKPFDIVRTMAGSTAEVKAYGYLINIPPVSKIQIGEVPLGNVKKGVIEIERGSVKILPSFAGVPDKIDVKTFYGTISIEGKKADVDVSVKNTALVITNNSNAEVVLNAGNQKLKIKENFMATLTPGSFSIRQITPVDRKIIVQENPAIVKPVTEANTSLLSSSTITVGTNNTAPSAPIPPVPPATPVTYVDPSLWDTKTNITIDYGSTLDRTTPNGPWGKGTYPNGWIIPNIGTDSVLTSGSTLHLSAPYKLHEVYDWGSGSVIPLTQYFGVATEADLLYNVQFGNNAIFLPQWGFTPADSTGNQWYGSAYGLTKPNGTFKMDYRFMYVTPDGEIGYGKLASPFTGDADTINSILKSSSQYTLTPVGNINFADFEANPGNYYFAGGSLNFDPSLFDNDRGSSTLYQWNGANKGIFLGVNQGLLLQPAPSGNKTFLGSLDWNVYNKTTFVTTWENGEVTGTFTGKYMNEKIYGTSSGTVFGLYDTTENNYAIVASGDITGTPVSAFASSSNSWDPINNFYRWEHGYATLAPTSLLTPGNNIYGYGYTPNSLPSGKYIDIENGYSLSANNLGWDTSKDVYDSKGLGILDVDNKLYSGNFIGVYRRVNGEAGIWRYNIQSSGNIDADGYYDISGSVSNFIPIENTLVTVDRPSQVFVSALDWWNLSQGYGSLNTNGITISADSQHAFQIFGYSLADCTSFPCSALSWGYSNGKLSGLKYTSMSPSFSLITNDPGQMAGYVITASDNLNGTVTGKYYGGNMSSNIGNGDTNVYLTAGDVTGAYNPATSTLNMAMIGTHMSVNSYLSMVDDPAKQPTLQAMNIPITERYNATVNGGTFYDASSNAIGSFTTVGLNKIRAFGDTTTEGLWTMQITGNHAIDAGQWSMSATRLNLSASNLDGTSYNINIKGQNGGQLMSGGVWKGSVIGTGSNGMTLTGGAAGTYTGGDGLGVSGSFTGVGGGSWKR